MFTHRYGIKLKHTTADAAVCKLLRQQFPNVSLAELRAKVHAHDYLYLSDAERDHADGTQKLAKLLRECDQANLETELFEEVRDTSGSWQTRPMSREFLSNSIERSHEIMREVLLDIEREVTGVVSPKVEFEAWELEE